MLTEKKSEKISINGQVIELFYIATLANALGRTDQTVRKWEVGGILPKTIFKRGDRRLYSKEQIKIIVKCAEEVGLRQGSSTAKFQKLVHNKMAKYNQKFSNNI